MSTKRSPNKPLSGIPKDNGKHPGGRPSISSADLPENWQYLILEMSAEGCSAVEIRAKLCLLTGSFSRTSWDSLIEREKEFNATVKMGSVLCEAWWMEKGRTMLKHEKEHVFETALWFINMKNRFGWRDKQELDATLNNRYLKEDFKDMTDEEVVDLAKKILK